MASPQYGGLSENGDDSAWGKSRAWLRDWAPDVVLAQQTNGRAPCRLHAHLRRTADELAMTPVPGPASPGPVPGNHRAVLVSTAGRLQILDAGPPAAPLGGQGGTSLVRSAADGAGRAACGMAHQRLPAGLLGHQQDRGGSGHHAPGAAALTEAAGSPCLAVAVAVAEAEPPGPVP